LLTRSRLAQKKYIFFTSLSVSLLLSDPLSLSTVHLYVSSPTLSHSHGTYLHLFSYSLSLSTAPLYF
ncbi:unnamed protein product, partial [Brassica oleracea]